MSQPPLSPRSPSGPRPSLRSRASSNALGASQGPTTQTTPSHHHSASVSSSKNVPLHPKTTAWMQKLRKWKSRDDGLWGCAGESNPGWDGAADDAYAFVAADSHPGESKTLPPLPELPVAGQYALAYHGSYSDITSSGGSGTSSQRSSLRSSTHSTRSRSSGLMSPSIASASSMSRQDLLAREQEGAIEAITSYMARTHSLSSDSSSVSAALSPASPMPPSPTSAKFPSAGQVGPYGTIRPSDRQTSVTYAKTRPRADTSAAFSPSPPASSSSIAVRRSPSMQQLRTVPPSRGYMPAPLHTATTAPTESSSPTRPALSSITRPRALSSATDVHASRPSSGTNLSGSRRTSGAVVPPLPSNVVMYEMRGVDKALYAQAQSAERSYTFI